MAVKPSRLNSDSWQRRHISLPPGVKDTGLYKRCLVASFEEGEIEIPSLSYIKKWSSVSWKVVFGINIHEMSKKMFLFEFPNRNIAEQIIQREWSWKKTKVSLQWWNPVTGCIPATQNSTTTWIRSLGVPLQLWSQQVFRVWEFMWRLGLNRRRDRFKEPLKMGKNSNFMKRR